jgi:hypothetical protein
MAAKISCSDLQREASDSVLEYLLAMERASTEQEAHKVAGARVPDTTPLRRLYNTPATTGLPVINGGFIQ